jgi:nucleoside-specific outer membrane channel protein Tsx
VEFGASVTQIAEANKQNAGTGHYRSLKWYSLEKRTVVSSEQKQEILLHKYLEVKRNSTFFILYGFLDTTLYNQWF